MEQFAIEMLNASTRAEIDSDANVKWDGLVMD
jgi:hypothetical protein